jgi:hypothetical protein
MGADARTLIERQRQAGPNNEYEILDKLQQYVREYRSVDKAGNPMPVTRKTKQTIYNMVRSFFTGNRVELPSDKRFGRTLRGEKPPGVARLSVEDIHRLSLGATLREKSMLLTQFQTLSGIGELEYINLNCGDEIIAQMRQGKHPVRIDMLMGRKTNPEPYHTFIGKDAIEALREYFEKERGWPAKGEPIWISKPLGEFQKKQLKDTTVLPDGRVPVLRDTYRDNIRQLTRRIGLIPKQESHARGVRYGYNPNEIRDVARSVSRKATSSGFDIICAEFWMGHTIDPLGYDKQQKLEPEWSAEQYRLVEPYLNIISIPPTAGATDLTQAVLMAEFNILMRRAKSAGLEREFITTIERNVGSSKVPRMVGRDMDDYYRAISFDAVEARNLIEGMQRAGPGVFEKTIEDLTAVLERPTPPRRRTKRRPETTEKIRPAKKRAENRRQRRSTARNGGAPLDAPYDTRIVGEDELVPLLNEGWGIVKELRGGRIIIRRPNDRSAKIAKTEFS